MGERAERADSYQIDTIRVQTRQLDRLMNQAGELVVIRTRIAHRLDDIKEMVDLCEELNSSLFARRNQLRVMEKSGVTDLNKLAELQEREDLKLENLSVRLAQLLAVSSEDNARLEAVSANLEGGVRGIRMLPLSTVFNLYPRMVRDIAREQGKKVELFIEGGETTADKRVLEEMKDPLMHMLRNSVSHGIEVPGERERLGKPVCGAIHLKARCTSSSVVIEVSDDGCGLDLDAIRATALKQKLVGEEELQAMNYRQLTSLIFNPGFTTQKMITDISGRGVGMDVVHNNVEALKGSIQIESNAGVGCGFTIQLPLTLATTRVLLLRLSDNHFALPVEFVATTLRITPQRIYTVEGRQTISVHEDPVSVAYLLELLELSPAGHGALVEGNEEYACILIQVGDDLVGLLVDEVVDEQEVVHKPCGAFLKRVRNVSGSTILGSGEVCMILSPADLVRSIATQGDRPVVATGLEKSPDKKIHRVLLVEDSITTRIQEKRILEGAGYQVVQAVDGLDALEKLGSQDVDVVVSDITMPNMDGLQLTEAIRRENRYLELPIILVTMLGSDEDKRRGLVAGANAYLTKPAFDQKVLLDTLQRLL